MQAQIKFFFALLKLILNVFPREPKLPLMSSIGPLLNTKKLYL